MPIPSPKERPDLYDSFDLPERPEGWVNPVKLSEPEHIRKRKAEFALQRKKLKLKPAAE